MWHIVYACSKVKDILMKFLLVWPSCGRVTIKLVQSVFQLQIVTHAVMILCDECPMQPGAMSWRPTCASFVQLVLIVGL